MKVRNQCNCIIAYQLGESNNPDKNGEAKVLKKLASCCKTFVDVGANVGEWTAEFLHNNKDVKGWLYEPSSQCATKLETRFNNNHVTVRNVAVSNFNGQTNFAEEAEYGEGSSIAGTHSHQGQFRETEVNVITLDWEFADTTISIDFLKIDTEGYDFSVLQGAETLLAEARVRFIQFEYNTHWLNTNSTLQSAFALLERHGFSCYLIRSTGLHTLDYKFWGEFYRYSNFLAIRKEDIGLCEDMIRHPI